MAESQEITFKIICIGDGAAGKTSLISKFTKGIFSADYKFTIGMDFSVKIVEITDSTGNIIPIKLRIWDIGGHEDFNAVRPLFYKGAKGCVVLFDVTNNDSFEHLPKWIEDVIKNTGKIPVVIVGNKIDLAEHRVVKKEEAEAFTSALDVGYIETSAKDGSNVIEAFKLLSELMFNDNLEK